MAGSAGLIDFAVAFPPDFLTEPRFAGFERGKGSARNSSSASASPPIKRVVAMRWLFARAKFVANSIALVSAGVRAKEPTRSLRISKTVSGTLWSIVSAYFFTCKSRSRGISRPKGSREGLCCVGIAGSKLAYWCSLSRITDPVNLFF